DFEIKSPDGEITVTVEVGAKLSWSMNHKEQEIIAPSTISLELENGEVLGENAEVTSDLIGEVDTEFEAINYRKAIVPDHYSQLSLNFEGDYGVNFRVYDDAVAYQFFTEKAGELIIKNEEANFNFTADHRMLVPYLWDYRQDSIYNA